MSSASLRSQEKNTATWKINEQLFLTLKPENNDMKPKSNAALSVVFPNASINSPSSSSQRLVKQMSLIIHFASERSRSGKKSTPIPKALNKMLQLAPGVLHGRGSPWARSCHNSYFLLWSKEQFCSTSSSLGFFIKTSISIPGSQVSSCKSQKVGLCVHRPVRPFFVAEKKILYLKHTWCTPFSLHTWTGCAATLSSWLSSLRPWWHFWDHVTPLRYFCLLERDLILFAHCDPPQENSSPFPWFSPLVSTIFPQV